MLCRGQRRLLAELWESGYRQKLGNTCWKTPSGVRMLLMTCPCPPHWLHVLAVVPGFVPLPSQVPQFCRLSTCTGQGADEFTVGPAQHQALWLPRHCEHLR